MKRFLLLLMTTIIFTSCGIDELSQKYRDEDTSDDVTITPLEDIAVEVDDAKIQKGVYNAMGVSSSVVPSVTARGEWCVGEDHMNEFRCGYGNPGGAWVVQSDGCYHLQTDRSCSCSVGSDWYDHATYECKGNVLYIVDACGDEKFVSNHSNCLDNNDGTIDTLSKSKVKKAYNEIYKKASPSTNWTGNVNSCIAGKNSIAFQERVMEQINFYRGMAGIPLARLVPDMEKYQEAALIMDANYTLTHNPS